MPVTSAGAAHSPVEEESVAHRLDVCHHDVTSLNDLLQFGSKKEAAFKILSTWNLSRNGFIRDAVYKDLHLLVRQYDFSCCTGWFHPAEAFLIHVVHFPKLLHVGQENTASNNIVQIRPGSL